MFEKNKSAIGSASSESLATECAFVSEKICDVLTAIQLKAGILAEATVDKAIRAGLNEILAFAQEATRSTEKLRNIKRKNHYSPRFSVGACSDYRR